MKAKAVADAHEALADPLEVLNTYFLAGQPFIGGDHPSIADFRLAATLEFLRGDRLSACPRGPRTSWPGGGQRWARRTRSPLRMCGATSST